MWDYIKENLLAFFAAIVATIDLIWHIYDIWRDKAKIVLEHKKNMKIFSKGSLHHFKTDTDYFIISVINKGRRPVTIETAGVCLYKGEKKFQIFSDSFAIPGKRILTETNPTTDFACEQSLLDLNNIKYLWAGDAVGRTYKKYIHKIPFLWRVSKLIPSNK